jgi:pantoate--beta-alanine ligase
MQIVTDPEQMQCLSGEIRLGGKRLGFVPTMGALHDGHLSLVKMARTHCAVVVASIFVNPLQFGPNEDFAKYPRSFERDCQLLNAEKVDIIFAPTKDAMYPPDAKTMVEVAELSEKLDGRSRPGHFKGVTTVVAKLFGIVQPDRAYFGQKDAAQIAIIKRMVRDLNIDVEIMVGAIVREPDGLAMSSRNIYLDPQQRHQALILYRTLNRIQYLRDRGERNAARLIEKGKAVVAEEPNVRLDYLEIVNPDSLDPVDDVSKGALVAIAAYFGTTRLIDNILL